jgi:hypothetical protein
LEKIEAAGMILPAAGTIPMLPETTWQERYPEDVTHLKNANLFSSTLLETNPHFAQ